jgi:hypothetical protein
MLKSLGRGHPFYPHTHLLLNGSNLLRTLQHETKTAIFDAPKEDSCQIHFKNKLNCFLIYFNFESTEGLWE